MDSKPMYSRISFFFLNSIWRSQRVLWSMIVCSGCACDVRELRHHWALIIPVLLVTTGHSCSPEVPNLENMVVLARAGHFSMTDGAKVRKVVQASRLFGTIEEFWCPYRQASLRSGSRILLA